MDTTQPSLLSRVRDPSDELAWREFDAKYRELILRYCRARGLQSSDAEDVSQIVMMDLSKALRNFEYSPGMGRFRGYLGCVVRNAVNRYINSSNKGSLAFASGSFAIAEESNLAEVDQMWEAEWIRHHYRLAMQTVRVSYDPRSVKAFDRLLAGETVAQVAEGFDMSLGAVHKVKQRIRDRLKELIATQIREEDYPDERSASDG